MPTLAYRLRILGNGDDLIVTSLAAATMSGEISSFEDSFESYADTAALLAAGWTLDPGDMGGAALVLDATGGAGGGKCAELTVPAGADNTHLGAIGYLLVTGLTPSTLYTIRGKIKTNWEVLPLLGVDGPVLLGLRYPGDGASTILDLASAAAFNSYESLQASHFSNASGEIEIVFGFGSGIGTLGGNRAIRCDDLSLSVVGEVPNQPYIAEPPQGDGQTLNPLNGEVQTGGFTVAVIDAEIAANTRVVTSKLADAGGRNQLLSRRAYIEESEDQGNTWNVLMAGYVNSVRLVSAIRFEFTIGESRRVEQTTKVFQFAEPGFDRVSPLLGGTLGDFGPYSDEGRPRFVVVHDDRVSGDVVTLKWLGGPLLPPPIHENTPPIPDYNLNYINHQARHYIDATSLVSGLLSCPGLTARLMDINTGPALTSNPPAGFTEADADFMPLGFTFVPSFTFSAAGLSLLTPDGRIFLNWPASRGDQPSVGDRFKLIVFPREISERNPLHWIGHPVDLATRLLALRGESYNAASAAAVKSELGSELLIEIRITAAMTLAEALEKIVYGPFGVAARTNDAGEREFFTTRRDFVPPVDTITNDDLTSADGIVWATEEGSAINKVTFKTTVFNALPPGDPDPDPENPLDWIGTSSVTVEAVPDESEGAVFGDHAAGYELPGNIKGLTTGTPANPGTLDEFVALIGAELFDFQGRGAITSEISVRRGVTDALIGETVTLDLAHLPTASPDQSPTSQRGAVPRVAVVLRRTPTPSGPVLKLQDRGIAPSEQVGIVPEFTIDKSTADPRKIATVTITNGAALEAAGVKVRVQMATGSSTPTSGTSVRLLDPATDPLTFDLPAVCAGSKVWARMRSELTGFLPSDWSSFLGVQLDALDPPTSLAGVFTGTQIALSWVLGANAADIPIEILLRETGDPDFMSVALLPPGTLSYELTVPDPATEYDIGVRHHEAAPFDCVSSTTTLGAVTSGTVEETPPPDLPPPPAPVSDAGSGLILIPLHAALTHGSYITELPAALTPLHDYALRRVDASGCARCRVQAHVSFPLPAGAYVAAQYVPATNTDPAEEDWVFLNGTTGPTLPVDAVTVIPDATPWHPLDLLARQDIVIRGVCVGGNEVTPLGLKEMFVELVGKPVGTEPQNPDQNDPCQDSTIGFGGYETDVEFLEDWSVEENDMAGAAISLDLTGGVGGSRCGKLTVPGGADNTHVGAVAVFLLTGLAPSTMHTITGQIKTDWEITGGFGNDGPVLLGLRYPGDEASTVLEYATSAAFNQWEDLTASHFSNGSGELEIVFGFGSGIGSLEATRAIRCDDIVVTGAGGIVVNPCSGGPTIPGDGGFEPPPGDPGPIIPPPATGIRSLSLDSVVREWSPADFPLFFGTVHNAIQPNQLIATLDAFRAVGWRFIIDLVGHNRPKVNGSFSLSTYMAILETYSGIDISGYSDVVQGIYVIDEPFCTTCWGITQPIQFSVVDGIMAKRTSELFPDIPLFVRASSHDLQKRGAVPKYINVSINQWTGPGTYGYPDLAAFMAANNAAAAALNLRQFWSFNVAHFTASRRVATPEEIRRDGIPMARDTASFGLNFWAGLTVYPASTLGYLTSAPYNAAFADVRAAVIGA